MPRIARVRAPAVLLATALFYLGTHQPSWLWTHAVPLFVSRRRLQSVKRFRRALARWALDSGGFTELQLYGRWTLSPEAYVALVRRFVEEIGNLDWAAPQDWMCEPAVIRGLVRPRKRPVCKECKKVREAKGLPACTMRTARLLDDERPVFECSDCGATKTGKRPAIPLLPWLAWAREAGPVLAESLAAAEKLGIDAEVVFHGTGLSVEEHQRRTIENLKELRRIDAAYRKEQLDRHGVVVQPIRWAPVLQGWRVADYWRHLDDYRAAGIELRGEPVVGVGSVCRRQNTREAETIFRTLAAEGLRLHGFGVKLEGLARFADVLASSDSLAWSFAARNDEPLPGHDRPGPGRRTGHINCANCAEYALIWRERVVGVVEKRRRELLHRCSARPLPGGMSHPASSRA